VVCCQHQVGAGTIGRTYSSRGGRIVGGGEGMVSRPMWLWRWVDVPPPLLVRCHRNLGSNYQTGTRLERVVMQGGMWVVIREAGHEDTNHRCLKCIVCV